MFNRMFELTFIAFLKKMIIKIIQCFFKILKIFQLEFEKFRLCCIIIFTEYFLIISNDITIFCGPDLIETI